MTIQCNLHTSIARILWGVAFLATSGVFVGIVFIRFVIAVVSDPQIEIRTETLAAAAQQFPQSASLHARLAARLIETGGGEKQPFEETAQQAIYHASQAVRLAPGKTETWVLLAAARELTGALTQAEADLRAAMTHAPQRTALNWRLANLLLRKGQYEAALPEFRLALASDPKRLPPTLPLLWQATGGNFTQVADVVPTELSSQVVFAKFLVQQKQAATAVEIFSRLDRKALLGCPESKQLLDALIANKEFGLADQIWQHLLGLRTGDSLLWNGGFEATAYEGFNHLDWQLSANRYAHQNVTDHQSRTGNQALALEYLGIETTRLEQEIKQIFVVRPGLRYRLEGYAKSDSLITGDGPRLVITKLDGTTIIAETSVVVTGTHDWHLLATDFIAPADTTALLVTIKQTPRFTYSTPTQGTVYFDDLVVRER